eukprot:PLAT2629.2.p1 GENE.PLAT2629.2~~PLAT2629.2.p1  ORF type:complete len:355 (-),score=105.19 PLAT2629.2:38-1057(-)
MYACKWNKAQCAIALLNAGAETHAATVLTYHGHPVGMRAIDLAAACSPASAAALIEAGHEITKSTLSEATLSAAVYHGFWQAATRLLLTMDTALETLDVKLRVKIEDACLPTKSSLNELKDCIGRGDVDGVSKLLMCDVDGDAMQYMADGQGTALHRAVRAQQEVVVQTLLEWPAELEVADAAERTPLAIAAEVGNASCVHLLLKAGASYDSGPPFPITLAAGGGHTRVCELLLEAGADWDVPPAGIPGRFPDGSNVVTAALLSQRPAAVLPFLRVGATLPPAPADYAWPEETLAAARLLCREKAGGEDDAVARRLAEALSLDDVVGGEGEAGKLSEAD